MSVDVPRALQKVSYERAALTYLLSLPPEHFMEGIPQASQREITLESLALLRLRRPEVRVFNELLVQYPRRGRHKLGQVVPDNMVVLTTEPIEAETCYNVSLEPAPPFWVLEYISPSNMRKDYIDSFKKYERELKVPYYLMFYPDRGALTLHRHNNRKYVVVKPNKKGRCPIPKLELEVGLLDGWVRYWHQGELLPLPADLQRELDATRLQAEAARQQAEAARQQAEAARQLAEQEKLRADELQQRLEAAERELAKLRARRGQS
jgi:Uma2 family endonuclease